jgi:hypothetical protein
VILVILPTSSNSCTYILNLQGSTLSDAAAGCLIHQLRPSVHKKKHQLITLVSLCAICDVRSFGFFPVRASAIQIKKKKN